MIAENPGRFVEDLLDYLGRLAQSVRGSEHLELGIS